MQHTMGPQAQDYAVASVSLSKNMERVEQTGPDRVSMTTLAPSSALAADIAEAGGSWAGVVFPKRGPLCTMKRKMTLTIATPSARAL